MFGPEWEMMSEKQKQLYIKLLRNMPPTEKLKKACELSDMADKLAILGIKRRNPDFNDKQILLELARIKLPKSDYARVIKAIGD